MGQHKPATDEEPFQGERAIDAEQIEPTGRVPFWGGTAGIKGRDRDRIRQAQRKIYGDCFRGWLSFTTYSGSWADVRLKRLRLRLLVPTIALIVVATMIPVGLRHPSRRYIQYVFDPADFLNNILLYMPLGIALCGTSLRRAFLFGLSLSTV